MACICGGGAYREINACGQPWQRCRECGSVALGIAALDAAWTYDAPQLDGDPRVTSWDRPADPVALGHIAFTVRRIAPGPRVVDIAAGDGRFVEVAGTMGLEVMGLERSPEGHARAAARGVELFDRTLESISADHHAVTLRTTLEQLREPAVLVAAARRLLVPGGVIAVTVGNAGGLAARLAGRHYPPLHLERFGRVRLLTGRGIRAMFDRAGMRLVGMESFGLLSPGEGGRDHLWPWRAGRSPRLAAAASALTDSLRGAAESLHLGDRLHVYARR